jgi:CRISPR system Cascade subunit CasE
MSRVASALTLSPGDMRRLKITDPYSIHRVVYSLFQDKEDRILYCDLGGGPQGRQLLILSGAHPEDPDGKLQVLSRAVPDNFTSKDNYGFKIVINPVRCDSKTGKRVPIKDPEEIKQWFLNKAPSWGFSVSEDAIEILRTDVLQFDGKGKNRITAAQAHVRGLLSVLDRDLFRNSFEFGIGRSKAFGCGLLQLQAL